MRSSFVIVLLSLSACTLWQPPRRPTQQLAGAQRQAQSSHVVSRGETLSSIARKYLGEGGKWSDIAAVNPGLDPNRLRPGQEIFLPGGIQLAANDMSVGSAPRFRLTPGKDSAGKDALPPAKRPVKTARLADKKSEKSLTAKAATKTTPKATAKTAAKKTSKQTAKVKPPKQSSPLNDSDFALSGSPKGELGDQPAPKVELASAAEPKTAKVVPEKPKATPKTAIASASRSASKSGSAPLRMGASTTTAVRNDEAPRVIQDSENIVLRRPSASKPPSQVARSSFYSCMADKCALHKSN